MQPSFDDTTSFSQAVLAAVIAARLELITFFCGMVLYTLLVLAPKRFQYKEALAKQLEAKLSQHNSADADDAKDMSPNWIEHADKRTRDNSTKRRPVINARAQKDVPSASADVAKQIVSIRKHASQNNLEGVMSVFESLKESDVQMNSIIYNTVLDACVKCQDLKAASSWMEKIKEAGMVDTVSYNILMKAFMVNKDLDKARDIVRQMKEAGFQPNCVTFNELINSVVSGGGSQTETWKVVKEMREFGMAPNQVTCSILLKHLNARSSDADVGNTMDLISGLKEPMDEVLMSSLVEACVRIGKPALLTSKLQQLERTRKLSVSSSHTLGSMIKAYGYAHDMDGVWRCWKQLRSQHIKPTSITLGCMIEAMVNNGCTEEAFELIQQLKADPQCRDAVNPVVFCTLLKGFTREKKLQRALAVYQEMEETDVEMSLVTFNTVIDACARVGHMDHLPKIMQRMKKCGVEPNIITYSTMLKGHCQSGNIELGFSILNDMRRETNLKPDEILYNSLIDGCAKNGLHEQGLQLLDEMVSDGIRPSNFTLSILVKLLNRSRKVDQAFALVEEFSQKYKLKPNVHVYTNLIQACVSNRRHGRVMAVVETMVKERVQLDSHTYGILIRSSLFQGQFEQTVGLLRAAMGLPGALEILADARFAACPNIDNRMVNDALASLAERGFSDSLVAPLLTDIRSNGLKVWIDPAVMRQATMHCRA